MSVVDQSFEQFRRSGDPVAFARVYDETAAPLFRLALTLAPDAAAAEDALQETYLAAIECAARWDAERPLVPWLVGTLRHKLVDQHRRRRDDVPLDRPIPTDRVDPLRAATDHEARERVRAAIELLPEPYRSASRLRWREGLEPTEIAERTGRRPGTVRVTLYRALHRLRRQLAGTVAAVLPGLGEPVPRGLEVVRSGVLRAASRPARLVASTRAASHVGAGRVIAAAAALVVGAAVSASLLLGGPSGTDSAFALDAEPSPPVPERVPRSGENSDPMEPADASRASGDVVGLVVDAKGRPVEGAEVVVFPQRLRAVRSLDAVRASDRAHRARSAADGTYSTLRWRPEVAYDLVVVAQDGRVGCAAGVQPTSARRLVLAGAKPLAVRVRDLDGEPVADARVVARRRLSVGVELDATGTTALDGMVRLGAARDDSLVWVDVRAAGFVPWVREVEPADVTAGEPLDVRLMRGVPLSGTITDSDTGDAVPGAEVVWGHLCGRSVWRREGRQAVRVANPRRAIETTSTDGQGRFRFDAVPPSVVVHARAAGYCVGLGSGQAVPGEPFRIALELRPSVEIRGRVVDERGDPVPGARLRCTPLLFEHVPLSWCGSPGAEDVVTGPDGGYWFHAPGSARGEVRFRVHAHSPSSLTTAGLEYPDARRASRELRPVPGTPLEVEDFVLPVPVVAARGVIRVVDEHGEPVAGAEVECRGAHVPAEVPFGSAGRTDDSGRLELRWMTHESLGELFAGDDRERVVVVRARGHAPAVERLQVEAGGEHDVEIVLAPARSMVGSVVDHDGDPAPGARVSVECDLDGHRLRRSTTTDDHGVFVVDDLPDRPFGVRARPGDANIDGKAVVELPTPRRPGDAIELRLPETSSAARGALRLLPIDESSGEPVCGVRVELSTGTGPAVPRRSAYVASPDESELSIEDLPAGRLALRVSAAGYEPHVRAVRVAADELSELSVPLRRARHVAGHVRFVGLEKHGVAILRLYEIHRGDPPGAFPPRDPATRLDRGSTDFRVDAVGSGTHRLVAHHVETGRGFGMFAQRTDESIELRGDGSLDSLPVDLVPAGWLFISTAVPALPAAHGPDVPPLGDGPVSRARLTVADDRGRVVLDRAGVWRDRKLDVVVPVGRWMITLETGDQPALQRVVQVGPNDIVEVEFGDAAPTPR